MFSKKLVVGAISGILLLTAGYSFAEPIDNIDRLIAREASEGPRGGDNERPGDRQHRGGRHGATTVNDMTAREAGSRGRGKDGVEKPGLASDIEVIAREAGSRGRGKDGAEKPGYAEPINLAREATEGPRGGDNERPGDRQRRGGRNGSIENPEDAYIIARRGADDPPGTEHPGDNHRQRRGGRA